MFCVIYRSIAETTIGQSDISNLLKQAKTLNRANDITGCLLFYDNEFVQYLEGDRVRVTMLFEKIKRDQRHTNVQLLFAGHIYSREFEDWTMAYEDFMDSNTGLKPLKLALSSYFNQVNTYKHLNPTTKKFWVVVKSLLSSRSVEKFK